MDAWKWLRCLVLILPAAAVPAKAEVIRLTVRGTDQGPKRQRLVEWPVPETLRTTPLTLRPGKTARPAQRSLDGERLFWIEDVGAGQEPRILYDVETATDSAAPPATATLKETAEAVEIVVAGSPVLSYHIAPRLPDGVDAVYRRSGHIHPLRSPGGKVLTDEFPEDHRHQHAIFFAWVNTRFEGRHVDFWNQPGREGIVEHQEIVSKHSGPVQAGFHAKLTHSETPKEQEARPVLHEEWIVSAARLGDHHVVDLESRQRAATDSPLEILKYHYGGMGIRGAAEWALKDKGGEGCEFLTSDGADRKKGDQAPCRWVRLSGTVGGNACGLAVLCHPANFRAPQPVRIHPAMPYFAFSPCIGGDFSIDNSRDYVSRYRIIAFDEVPTAEFLEALWSDYAHPLAAAAIED